MRRVKVLKAVSGELKQGRFVKNPTFADAAGVVHPLRKKRKRKAAAKKKRNTHKPRKKTAKRKNAKMYLTSAEAKAKGLPSNQQQIDRWNRYITALKKKEAAKRKKKNTHRPRRRKAPNVRKTRAPRKTHKKRKARSK